jgi:ubiquinone/menaquinone biosynthesis C-methylase UbiE
VNKQKEKWNELALEDAKYYVCAKRGDSDEKFRQYGEDHYEEHIINDGLIKSYVPIFSNAIVMEIGCGIGRMTEFFALDFKGVFAIDVSDKMIDLAKERLSNMDNVSFVETDGESFPLSSNSVDFVFSFLVFQHIPSIESIEKNFKEVHRVLKEDGLFKVQIRGVEVPMGKWYSGVSFDAGSAKELCDKTGFKIIKYADINKRSFWLWLKNEK